MNYLLVVFLFVFLGCENLNFNKSGMAGTDVSDFSYTPIGRSGHSMLWTGSKILVIGGFHRPLGNDGDLTNVDLYDPATDSWTQGQNMPSVLTDGSKIIWTGSEALILRDPLMAYNSTSNEWRQIETSEPIGHDLFVWSGNRLFVCCTGNNSASAAFVNPADGSVEEVPGFSFPAGNDYLAGIIGTASSEAKIFVWYRVRKYPGTLYDYDHYVAIFDKATEQWTRINKNGIGAPNPQGKYLTKYDLVGKDPLVYVTELGYSYNPVANIWQDLGAPNLRHEPAILAEGKLIYWLEQRNDDSGNSLPATGYIYDIDRGLWSDMSLDNAPELRRDYRAVWTGTEMLVFGGSTGKQFEEQYPTDVGSFDPETNSWSAKK